MQEKKLLSHAATILPVKDIKTSSAYYSEQLGFQVLFEWGNPTDYVVLKRDDAVSIHLSKRIDDRKPSDQHVTLYIFTHDVDALHKEFEHKEVPISTPIGTRDYGMRDFDVKDPDGHVISFGQGITE